MHIFRSSTYCTLFVLYILLLVCRISGWVSWPPSSALSSSCWCWCSCPPGKRSPQIHPKGSSQMAGVHWAGNQWEARSSQCNQWEATSSQALQRLVVCQWIGLPIGWRVSTMPMRRRGGPGGCQVSRDWVSWSSSQQPPSSTGRCSSYSARTTGL